MNTPAFGKIGASRSYIQDRGTADDCFERIAWPVLRERVGGVIVNTSLLGTAGDCMDKQAGIDFIWSSNDGKPATRAGYGPTFTGGMATPPSFIRGLAARFQHLDYKTFTIRAHRYSGAETELSKRLDQTLGNHDHGELVAGYTAQAYGCSKTGQLLRVAMIKTRDLMMLYRYGKEGRDYYRQSTSNADFICFDWDGLPLAYSRCIGAPLWLERIDTPNIEQSAMNGDGFFATHGRVTR